MCSVYPPTLNTFLSTLVVDNDLSDPVGSRRFVLMSSQSPMLVLSNTPIPNATACAQQSNCHCIRPPWFHRKLLPFELSQNEQQLHLASKMGYNLFSTHNLQRTRVILVDLGSSLYDGWKGNSAAARSVKFVVNIRAHVD